MREPRIVGRVTSTDSRASFYAIGKIIIYPVGVAGIKYFLIMALIKCDECGQMVSDKAMSCPHCGCPIEKEVTCPECGNIIENGLTMCNNCGFDIQDESVSKQPSSNQEVSSDANYYHEEDSDKRKKQVLWISLAFAAILITLGVCFWPNIMDQIGSTNEIKLSVQDLKANVDTLAVEILNRDKLSSALALLEESQIIADKAKDRGDKTGYFTIKFIMKSAWENNKEDFIAKFPGIEKKIDAYLQIPEDLKQGYSDFVLNAKDEAAIDNIDFSEPVVKKRGRTTNSLPSNNIESSNNSTQVQSSLTESQANKNQSQADMETRNWLRGKWVRTDIDPTTIELFYYVWTFTTEGYNFAYGSERVSTSNNDYYSYEVKGNIIYSSSNNPILIIDRSHNALIGYENNDEVYKKQ